MEVECIPLTEFVHGSITAHEGKPMRMEEGEARDLEKAGLVRIKISPPVYLPAAQAIAAGKAQDDGAGRPSSALPADPASPQQTLHLPKTGATRTRKIATQ